MKLKLTTGHDTRAFTRCCRSADGPRPQQLGKMVEGEMFFTSSEIQPAASRDGSRAVETRAFTLVEMILAIGCAAIVLVAINAAFFGGLRWRNTTQGLVDDASPVDLALSTLRHDLQGVVPPSSEGIMTGAFKVGDLSSTDIGDLVNLEFNTTTGALQENSPWGDIQRVTYSLKDPASRDAAGRELIRTVTRNLLGSGTVEVAQHWVMSGVDRISFQCYDGNQWQETWDTTALTLVNTNLPFAVRVKIQLTHGNSGVFSEQPVQMVVPIDMQSRTNRTADTES